MCCIVISARHRRYSSEAFLQGGEKEKGKEKKRKKKEKKLEGEEQVQTRVEGFPLIMGM